MTLDAESLFQSYQKNEADIRKLAASVGSTIDAIVDNPDDFSDEVVLNLQNLLERKESLLIALAPIQKLEIAKSPVVDMIKYRRLSKAGKFIPCIGKFSGDVDWKLNK